MNTQEEIESEQREARRKIREDAELFASLVKHPGWARYVKLLETVGQNYYDVLKRPLQTMDGALPSEYAKGALNTLSLAASLPSSKIMEAADLKPDAEE